MGVPEFNLEPDKMSEKEFQDSVWGKSNIHTNLPKDTDKMEEKKLLPCPFCGEYPELGHTENGQRTATCYGCGLRMIHDRPDKLQGMWNRRSAAKEPTDLTKICPLPNECVSPNCKCGEEPIVTHINATPEFFENKEAVQGKCEHDYQPDVTMGVSITCCTKCGDII